MSDVINEIMMPDAAIEAPDSPEAPTVVYEIGGNRYTVGIHFSKTSTETMADKIKCMIRRDILETE